jgi:hypothetical protein
MILFSLLEERYFPHESISFGLIRFMAFQKSTWVSMASARTSEHVHAVKKFVKLSDFEQTRTLLCSYQQLWTEETRWIRPQLLLK